MKNFLIDLHLHTAKYSPCAQTLDPWKLPCVLRERQLDGGTLTEHDRIWSVDEIQEIMQSDQYCLDGIRLYRGVEISTEYAHIVAMGLEDLQDVPPGVSLERLITVAHEQEAALIWAHPYLGYHNLRPPEAHPNIAQLAKGIHAVEVRSSVTKGESSKRAQQLAAKWGWIQVGGSDAHTLETVGTAATVLSFLPTSEKTLALAIKKGQCTVSSSPLIEKQRCL